jgi:hypothetical protein
MEEHRITVTDVKAVVEVLHIITEVAAATTDRGAHDIVGLGARTTKETTGTKNGDGMPKKATDGICRRIVVSVVSPQVLFLHK